MKQVEFAEKNPIGLRKKERKNVAFVEICEELISMQGKGGALQ